MNSELRPAVECELCAKLTPDMEQTAARMAAQIGGVMQCRECGRAYETQAAELAKFKALAETLAGALDDHLSSIVKRSTLLPGEKGNAVQLEVNLYKIADRAAALSEALREYKEARDAE